MSVDGVMKFMANFEARRMPRLTSKLARTKAKELFKKAKEIVSKYE
jgi:hypothetical protein